MITCMLNYIFLSILSVSKPAGSLVCLARAAFLILAVVLVQQRVLLGAALVLD